MTRQKNGPFLLLVGAALIVGVLAWLVVGHLVERKIALGGLIFTLLFMVAATLADWFTREAKGKDRSWGERLRNPNWIARVGMSVFFGLGAGLFVQQFVQPTEFKLTLALLEKILAGQDEVSRKLDVLVAPAEWRAFDSIDGYWGEELHDCRVVYRFERREHALTITRVRKEEGMGDYQMTASIAQSGQGDVLNATLRETTAGDEAYGQALVFRYFDDGAVKRLGWLNETRAGAETKLEWCGALSDAALRSLALAPEASRESAPRQ